MNPLTGHDEVCTACAYCGWAVSFAKNTDDKITCARCGSTVKKQGKNAVAYVAAFSISAFMLFVPALLYPVLDISVSSLSSSATVLGSIRTLYEEGLGAVGFLVLLTSVIIPMSFLLSCFYISLAVLAGRKFPFFTAVLRLTNFFQEWHMADVFLVGILVSIVKLIDMSELTFDYGIYLLMFVCAFTAITEVYYDTLLFRLKAAVND
ncbi:paraquat-inducible protein A [Geovibrio thiophilus]|nr:paraquat-inducible protein A [Geovibrio thiophilus]